MYGTVSPVHPLVTWGQNETHTFLSVHVCDAEDTVVLIQDENLFFSATGNGSNGRCAYTFTVDYYLPILSKQSRFTVTGRSIIIKLRKEYKDSWPRLTAQSVRLPWVRPDFDLYHFDTSDLNESDQESSELEVKVIQPSKEERARHEAELKALEDEEEWEAFIKVLKNPLTIYLLLYNLFQFAGFLCVFGAIIIHLFRPTWFPAQSNWYNVATPRLALVQALQLLEPLHALFGWVHGKIIPSLIQVFGRALILYIIVIPHDDLHETTTVFWLFFAWSAIELVRYPFYVCSLLGFRSPLLTYLRYTIWIPLYPLGFVCEGKLILLALPLLAQSGRFSWPMPNPLNMSFHLPVFLHIYLISLSAGFYLMMRHMYVQRRRVIGPRPRVGADQLGFFSYFSYIRSIVFKDKQSTTVGRLNASGLPYSPIGANSKMVKSS